MHDEKEKLKHTLDIVMKWTIIMILSLAGFGLFKLLQNNL